MLVLLLKLLVLQLVSLQLYKYTIMSTRKVTVYVFSYPADYAKTLSIKRLSEIPEVLDFIDSFISADSLEEIMAKYIDKVDVYDSFVDELRSYRIVLKDNERRIYKIHKV